MNQVMPMSETNLPQDPKDGDIVVSPDGSPVGYLDEMTVWQNDHVIGTAQSISRVENVSFKAIMVGCTSNKDLYPQIKYEWLSLDIPMMLCSTLNCMVGVYGTRRVHVKQILSFLLNTR